MLDSGMEPTFWMASTTVPREPWMLWRRMRPLLGHFKGWLSPWSDFCSSPWAQLLNDWLEPVDGGREVIGDWEGDGVASGGCATGKGGCQGSGAEDDSDGCTKDGDDGGSGGTIADDGNDTMVGDGSGMTEDGGIAMEDSGGIGGVMTSCMTKDGGIMTEDGGGGGTDDGGGSGTDGVDAHSTGVGRVPITHQEVETYRE